MSEGSKPPKKHIAEQFPLFPDVPVSAIEQPTPKKRRGRPPGSKNKKTIEAEAAQCLSLDASSADPPKIEPTRVELSPGEEWQLADMRHPAVVPLLGNLAFFTNNMSKEKWGYFEDKKSYGYTVEETVLKLFLDFLQTPKSKFKL